MSRRRITIVRSICVGVCVAGLLPFAAPPAQASNGMNMIGFGAESVSMGGADLAVTDSPSAMNINPAGLAHCVHPEFDFGVGLLNPSLRHKDAFGNNRGDSLDRYPMPFVAYVHPKGPLTWGVGLFVQGGLGAEYENLVTPPSAMANSGMLPPGFFDGDSVPATDDTRTNVMFAKLTPTVAWRIDDRWTVGASLNVGYARAEMRLFPNTSVQADMDMSGTVGDSPRDNFFGLDLDDASAFGFGLRVGFQYTRGKLALGGAYFTETSLDLDDGTLTLNLEALGPGRVDYDAAIDGFNWPRRAGFGVAYRIKPSFVIAGDLDWIDWSSAISDLAIEIRRPNRPVPPAFQSMTVPFRMDWDDQWVWAVGAELTPADDWAVRLGYNHGDTPIPDHTLKPLFPAIAEDHVTAGFGVAKGPWTFDMGLEVVLETEMTNNSADPTLNPFGPGSTEELSQVITHFMVRRELGRSP
jgi:long-chain fatty acid transport protein